jgi:hypothetical protein
MNKFINDFIKDLSIKDNKTLSQSIKSSWRSRWTCKVILPFDSAPGTMHRFSDREKNTWRDCGCIFNKYFNITFIRV